ncbi:MAG: hypothetical protein ACK56I_07865, partial [bacterium]
MGGNPGDACHASTPVLRASWLDGWRHWVDEWMDYKVGATNKQHCHLYSNPRLDPEFAPLFRTLLTDGSLCAFFNDTDQHLL